MKRNNKKGFTIVELVIVIAVIGILSAILIPTFIGLTNNAKATKLQADLTGAYDAYATTETEDTKPASYVLLEKDEVIMATAVIAEEGEVTLYMFDQTGAENKWSAVDKQDTGTYTLLNTEAYNGYYAYQYTPAAPSGD